MALSILLRYGICYVYGTLRKREKTGRNCKDCLPVLCLFDMLGPIWWIRIRSFRMFLELQDPDPSIMKQI